ncbi:MAG TPA: hypothetical protein DD734_11390 [Firmicutes bacterium]|nr:hypothetical protein [Bacillota bacterium]
MNIFKKVDNIISFVFLVVAVIYGYLALQMPYFGRGIIGAAFYPKILAIVMIALCLIFFGINRHPDPEAKTVSLKGIQPQNVIKQVAVVAVIAAYACGLFYFGFKIPTFTFFLALMLLYGEKKWTKLIFIPLVTTILFDVVFRIIFKLPFNELSIF